MAQAMARQLLSAALPSSECERRYRHKRGGVVWALSATTLLRDAAGQPQHFITQIQDITRRKQAEEALRQSEEQLRQVVETRLGAIQADNAQKLEEMRKTFTAKTEAAGADHFAFL